MKTIFVSVILLFIIYSCKNSASEVTTGFDGKDRKIDMNVAYIGTYTKKEGHVDGKADGIYTIYQDEKDGSIHFGELVATVINPSFLIISTDKKNLYAISELGPGDGSYGFIHSFSINPDHSLTEIGKISTESYAPCHITEDAGGQFIFVSNYVGGIVMMYEKQNDGSLKMKQKITLDDHENSHPHSVNISSNNENLYISDLGKSRIYNYILNTEAGTIRPHQISFIQLPEGTGPRHFEISESREYAYSINEHASTISTFKIEETGSLSLLNEVSTLPEGFKGQNSTADIHLHPSGKFIFASNRGHNSIVSYKIDQNSGILGLIEFTPTLGEKPRNFAISPDGNFIYVANQDSDNISAFKIDQNAGTLQKIQDPIEVKTPVCINFP